MAADSRFDSALQTMRQGETTVSFSSLARQASQIAQIAQELKVCLSCFPFFAENEFRLSSLVCVCVMQINRTLQKLDLDGNAIGEQGGRLLAEAVKVCVVLCCD